MNKDLQQLMHQILNNVQSMRSDIDRVKSDIDEMRSSPKADTKLSKKPKRTLHRYQPVEEVSDKMIKASLPQDASIDERVCAAVSHKSLTVKQIAEFTKQHPDKVRKTVARLSKEGHLVPRELGTLLEETTEWRRCLGPHASKAEIEGVIVELFREKPTLNSDLRRILGMHSDNVHEHRRLSTKLEHHLTEVRRHEPNIWRTHPDGHRNIYVIRDKCPPGWESAALAPPRKPAKTL